MKTYKNKSKSKKKIKDFPRVERPREKLMRYGPEKLSNSELLAVILRIGRKGENVVALANRVLKKFSGGKIANVSFRDLKKVSGIGDAKACEISACFELGKRLLKSKKNEIYLRPKDIWNKLKGIRNLKKEHFVVFYLDVRNQEIKKEIVSVGCLNASLVHPREVFESAVKNTASQIIIAHNHPSKEISPSKEDLEITRRLVDAGIILGIEIIDHIIVTENDFFSFREKGLI